MKEQIFIEILRNSFRNKTEQTRFRNILLGIYGAYCFNIQFIIKRLSHRPLQVFNLKTSELFLVLSSQVRLGYIWGRFGKGELSFVSVRSLKKGVLAGFRHKEGSLIKTCTFFCVLNCKSLENISAPPSYEFKYQMGK